MYIKGHKVIELIVPYSPFARFMVTTKLAYDENKIMKRASKKIFFSFFFGKIDPQAQPRPHRDQSVHHGSRSQVCRPQELICDLVPVWIAFEHAFHAEPSWLW